MPLFLCVCVCACVRVRVCVCECACVRVRACVRVFTYFSGGVVIVHHMSGLSDFKESTSAVSHVRPSCGVIGFWQLPHARCTWASKSTAARAADRWLTRKPVGGPIRPALASMGGHPPPIRLTNKHILGRKTMNMRWLVVSENSASRLWRLGQTRACGAARAPRACLLSGHAGASGGSRSGAKYSLFAGGCLLGATAAGLVYLDTGAATLGLKRNLKFWVRAFPMYLHYRVTEELVRGKTDEEAAAAYNALHDLYAKPAVELCIDMGGYFFKSAQIVSTRDEFVPHQYMAWLKGLQDRAPPQRSGDEVRALVSESIGRPLHEVFSRFDDEAIGAASVGQVHRAELAATGEDVAVKVMYPNVENLFRADINIIANFCWLAMPHHLPALREIEKQFLSEFDYVREAENMQRIARALNSHPYFRTRVLVPKPYPALCSREVLVMEHVPGQKLVDGIRAAMKPIAQRAGTTVEALEERERLRIREHGLLSASAASSRNRLLQAWAVCMCLVYNTAAVVHNWSLGLATGRVMDLRHVSVPPDLAALLQLLLDVHGYEIFQVGCFNGDPHPGNVLLMPDGRLGLIDYGSCVSLPMEHRQRLARLMISLLSPNPLDAVRVYSQEMGVKTKNMRSDILYKMAAFWYDRDSDDVTGGMNVHSFTEWLHVQDPVTFLPDEYVMPGRVSVLLRGMGAAFGIKIQTAHAWAPHARACLALVPNTCDA